MDFPVGGSGAIAAALERGILKNGGAVQRRSTVQEILVEDGRAVGLRVKRDGSGGTEVVKAKHVVSNTDLWSLFKLVPRGRSDAFDKERDILEAAVPLCRSFVHLHLGIEAAGLPKDIPPQWTVCR